MTVSGCVGIAATASRVVGMEPIQRVGKPRLRLSLAAYSFRDFFKDASHSRIAAPPPEKQLDLFQFLDFCADHECDGAELTAYYFPAEITAEFLARLKRHAFLRGVAISGSAVGNNFALPKGEKLNQEIAALKKWIDRAAALGAPHIRVFAGAPKEISETEARANCVSTLEECAEYAGSKGIFLGLENHGGIVSDSEGMLAILRAVKSRWLGVSLDTGNFHTTDPYADLAKIAPYAVNVQLKVEISPRGKPSEPADLPRLVKILRDANYQGYVALEYESKEDPWTAVPLLLKRLKELLAGDK